MTEQWIILSLCGTAVVGMGLWVVFFGFRIRWPKGTKVRSSFLGYEAVVIFERGEFGVPPDKHQQVADACAHAVWCAAEAWLRSGLGPSVQPAIEMTPYCCWFRADGPFEQWKSHRNQAKNTAAYAAQVYKPIGSGPAMAVIRERYWSDVIERGAPVIHEALHSLMMKTGHIGGDWRHANTEVWEGHGSATAEATAHLLFVESRRVPTIPPST